MGRNTKEATDVTTKRKFSVSTENLPTAAPVVGDKIYFGKLTAIKVDAPDKANSKLYGIPDVQLFDVVPLSRWSKEKGEDGKAYRESILEGGREVYTIKGAITYGVELDSSLEELPLDRLTIFGGRVNLVFAADDSGNWNLSQEADNFGGVNRTWVAFMKATGLTQDTLNTILEATPFEDDVVIEIPEHLEDVPDAETMLQACLFFKTFFMLVAEHLAGTAVKVNVIRETDYSDPTLLRNTINTGKFYSSCGLLPV
jgi:hypothetical protein